VEVVVPLENDDTVWFLPSSCMTGFNIGCFFPPCLTEKRRSNAPPDVLPVLCLRPLVEEVEQSMTGARRQTVALTITFRKSNKNLLELRAGGYRSSIKKTPYTFYLALDSLILFCTKNDTRTVKFQTDEDV
jgi:hypothetical protein